MKPHFYYKNQTELWHTGYKYHFACFNCKLSWKKSYSNETELCIKCNKIVRNVGVNFRVPKKGASKKYWNKLEKIVTEDHVVFEKPHCENLVCEKHTHIYWQGNKTSCHNCQIPFSIFNHLHFNLKK